MKLLEKLSTKVAKTASTAVKEEVQGAAIDILPTLFGIGGMIFGAFLFNKAHGAKTGKPDQAVPGFSSITITTNNYYFGDNFMNRKEEEDED